VGEDRKFGASTPDEGDRWAREDEDIAGEGMTPRKRKGPQKKHDWEAIRAAFVESSDRKSLRDLAQQFGVPRHATVHAHYRAENWEKQREAFRTKVVTKREQKTASKQADIEAKAIEIADGIMILHGYKVQGFHNKIKKARAIKNEKEREKAVDDILTSTDYVEYLKAHKLPDIGKYIRLMCGLPDSHIEITERDKKIAAVMWKARLEMMESGEDVDGVEGQE
jgi:uncharacterized Zn ribbon protein